MEITKQQGTWQRHQMRIYLSVAWLATISGILVVYTTTFYLSAPHNVIARTVLPFGIVVKIISVLSELCERPDFTWDDYDSLARHHWPVLGKLALRVFAECLWFGHLCGFVFYMLPWHKFVLLPPSVN